LASFPRLPWPGRLTPGPGAPIDRPWAVATGSEAMARDPYELAAEAAAMLRQRLGAVDRTVAVVLGSGWAPAAERIGRTVAEVPFVDLPGFPAAGVAGHAGVFRAVEVGGRHAVVMMGRVHLYEGHGPATVVHGVRSMILAGASTVILTNACGGLNPAWAPGTPVLIRDHINLTGASPLEGPNPDRLGPRFLDLGGCYSARLRAAVRAEDPAMDEGVYVAFRGPMYETPAEVAMVGRLGGDMVGMSTVLEAIAARHLGAEVLGIGLVTNQAAGLDGAALDHGAILEIARAGAERMGGLLGRVVAGL
jgi:purine-nucleoside phosphorylase